MFGLFAETIDRAAMIVDAHTDVLLETLVREGDKPSFELVLRRGDDARRRRLVRHAEPLSDSVESAGSAPDRRAEPPMTQGASSKVALAAAPAWERQRS